MLTAEPFCVPTRALSTQINVYVKGGDFSPHEDSQSITMLVNLSERAQYEGGGTAFWSLSDRGQLGQNRGPPSGGLGRPTFVIKPPPGSALIFGGQVTHAGLAVHDGKRAVFVASLSPAAIGAVCEGQWLPERELIDACGALTAAASELTMSGYGSGRYRD